MLEAAMNKLLEASRETSMHSTRSVLKLHSEKNTHEYGLGQPIHYRCFLVHNKNKQLLNGMDNLSSQRVCS